MRVRGQLIVPTEVEWDTRTECCFEDTKTYPSGNEPRFIGRSGLHGRSRKVRLLRFGAQKRGTNREGGADTPTDSRNTQPKSRGDEFGEYGGRNHA